MVGFVFFERTAGCGHILLLANDSQPSFGVKWVQKGAESPADNAIGGNYV